MIHDVGSPAKRAHGQTATDDFSEGGEIGCDAFELLHAAESEAESRHDFVEDEQRAVLGAELADGGEVAGLGGDEADVADVGFEDDAGDLIGMGGKRGGQGGGVIKWKDDGLAGETCGDAGAIRVPVGQGAGTSFDEQGIRMTMVAAGKLDDFIAPRETTGEPHGGHRGLGAAAGHADFFNGRNEPRDELGHFDFVGIGRAKGGAALKRGGDGGFNARVVVAVDRGPPGADEVDELAVVGGDERRAAGGLHVKWRTSDRAEGADWGVDAAGDELERAGEKFIRCLG